MTEAQRSRFERLQAQHPDAPLYSDLGFLLNLVRQMDNEAHGVTSEPVQRELVPEPRRQRIGIIGHSHIVAATMRSIQADPHYRPDAMDLVMMPLGEIVRIERDRLPPIAGSTLFRQVEVEPIEPKITLNFRHHLLNAGFPPREFPKPHFNGYMNKRRRKGKW